MAQAKAKRDDEKMVKIKIPHSREDDSDVFVSVNDRTWLIKRGVEVEVPECVAKTIETSEKATDEAYAYMNGKATS